MIVEAEEKDFMDIMFIYKACVKDMNKNGLFNWNTAYPGHEDVLSDIRKGHLFIYIENNVTSRSCMPERRTACRIRWL